MTRIIYRDPNVTIFRSALYQLNSTVVCTEDAIIVVDPAYLPEEVAEIRRFVDTIRGKRQVSLIFTHSHYDHIVGYKAFDADKVFMSKKMAESTNKELAVEKVLEFDEQLYLQRSYPILYPEGTFFVFRDGVQYRQGNTKMTFYTAPGHSDDGIMIVIWQLGVLIAGDYLSNIEFPFIYDSSNEYIETLEKLTRIHDRNWFTRLIPGHGDPALTINDWLQRRIEGLAYIYALRESIATQVPFDEESLWTRYQFSRALRQEHIKNMALMMREYEQGLWTWDPEFSLDSIEMPYESDKSSMVLDTDVEEE
jgi:hydroxyacylglutathione hydrolase